MRPSRKLGWWLVGLSAPTAVFAALWLSSLHGDASNAQADFHRQAEAAADTVAATLVRKTARHLIDGQTTLHFEATTGGALLSPAPRTATARALHRPAPTTSSEATVDWRAVEAQVVQFEKTNALDQGMSLLSRFLKQHPNTTQAVYAHSMLAAVAKQANNRTLAHTCYEHLAKSALGVRDSFGVPYALTARFQLQELQSPTLRDRLELYRDLLPYPSYIKTRTHRQVIEAFASTPTASAKLEPQLRELMASDLTRARQRRFALAFRQGGLANWIAMGAPGGSKRFPWPDLLDEEPALAPWIVATAEAKGNIFVGAVLEQPTLVRQILDSDELTALGEFGFAFLVTTDGGVALARAGQNLPANEAVSTRRLPAPFDNTTLHVYGSADTFVQAAKTRWHMGIAASAVVAVVLLLTAALIRRTLRREEETLRARENFVAAVTHELKSPLTSIRLLGELLQQPDLPDDKRQEFATRIVGSSDRLAGVVSAVLELARLERTERDRPRKSAHLKTLAAEMLSNLAPTAQDKGFSFSCEIPDELAVPGDSAALATALRNLCDNAAKHAHEPHTIEITAQCQPWPKHWGKPPQVNAQALALSVSDRGPGVPIAARTTIFKPFGRGGDELTRQRPGVGLGLAIAQRIAEAHGGELTFTPRPGGGSVFTLLLPAQHPATSTPTPTTEDGGL